MIINEYKLSDFSEASSTVLNRWMKYFPDCPELINMLLSGVYAVQIVSTLSLKNTATGISYVSCLIKN